MGGRVTQMCYWTIMKLGLLSLSFSCLFLFCCGIFVPRTETDTALTAVDVRVLTTRPPGRVPAGAYF